VTINLQIPGSWNQLNNWQLKKIAAYLHSNLSGVLFDYNVLLVLLDVRWWQILKRWKILKLIKNAAFSEIKKHYGWLYSDLSLTSFIPTIKTKSKTLYAPQDRINNLTADEFAHADDLYLGWLNTRDIEYLQYLAAVLYREMDCNGKRVGFDKTELDDRAKELSKIDRRTLLTISLSYQGSRSYMIAQFPVVFPKPKGKNKSLKNSGFGKLVLYLSGGKFGTYNQTKRTNVYVFLSAFEEQLKKKPHA